MPSGERKKPVLLWIRGSRVFVLATVGIGLFVDASEQSCCIIIYPHPIDHCSIRYRWSFMALSFQLVHNRSNWHLTLAYISKLTPHSQPNPTVPFIILSIDNGESPDQVDPNANPGDNAQVSQQTGILLALFAAGLLSKYTNYLSSVMHRVHD